MTKSTAPVAKTSALPAPAKRPFSIDICESSPKAFQLASALVRQGYVFLKDRPVEVYGMSGTAAFTVVLGEPDETGYADAEAAIRQGLEMEQAEFERRVEREVQARIEQIKRQEHEAKIAEQVAAHKQKVKELEAAAAAEIAKLEAEAQAQIAKIK
jgi:hypothetical protein